MARAQFLEYNSVSVCGVLFWLYSSCCCRRQALQGLLLGRVEVGGEVGEAGLGGELPQEVKQVLLDIQRVDRVSLAVRICLFCIVKVVFSEGKQFAEVHTLLGSTGVGRGITVLTITFPLIIVRFIKISSLSRNRII